MKNSQRFRKETNACPIAFKLLWCTWTKLRNVFLFCLVVMILQTQTPVVKSPLKSEAKLHCQFKIDHKAANLTVRWHTLRNTTSLVYYSSQSREQSGVLFKQMAAGDATFTIQNPSMVNEGTYMCCVNVHPLQGSLAVQLQIEGNQFMISTHYTQCILFNVKDQGGKNKGPESN